MIFYNNEKQFESSSSAEDVFGVGGKARKGRKKGSEIGNVIIERDEKRFSLAHKFTPISRSCDNFRSKKNISFDCMKMKISLLRYSASSCNSFLRYGCLPLGSCSKKEKKNSLIVEGKFSSLYFMSHQHTCGPHLLGWWKKQSRVLSHGEEIVKRSELICANASQLTTHQNVCKFFTELPKLTGNSHDSLMLTDIHFQRGSVRILICVINSILRLIPAADVLVTHSLSPTSFSACLSTIHCRNRHNCESSFSRPFQSFPAATFPRHSFSLSRFFLHTNDVSVGSGRIMIQS